MRLWQNGNMKVAVTAVLAEIYQRSIKQDIFSSAAQVAFYFSFAIFPLLLFLVTLLGIVLGSAKHFRADLYYYLASVMPVSAFELVRSTIEEISSKSSGSKLTAGLLIALWSASAGVDSLRSALNGVYGFEEKRPWLITKTISVTFTFVLAFLVTIALGVVFYGWQAVSLALSYLGLNLTSPFLLIPLQWAIVLLVLLLVFEILYNVLPCRRPFRWNWISPGAIIGIVLWLLLSHGLKTYLQYWNNYERFYGSLGAVIILMLWLYLTSLVILIGGMINSIFTAADGSEDGTQNDDEKNAQGDQAAA